MHLSTHYYVLSLSTTANALFEAFRDSLIAVVNQGFPVMADVATPGLSGDDRLQDLARAVDRHFAHYYALAPMGLILVGDDEMQSAFDAVTVHGSAVIGRIHGNHVATPANTLGQMVWPVVKEAMSGVLDSAMRELGTRLEPGRKAAGIHAVARAAGRAMNDTLLLEDDYHMRGSLGGMPDSPVIIPEVDVRETIDDVVDEVIERVLRYGGRVVFTPSGALSEYGRIILLLSDATRT